MRKLDSTDFESQKIKLTPDSGFNLVGIDYFTDPNGQLYLIEHFEKYQDALEAKKNRKNPSDYFILYKGPGNEYLNR